ncbi:hypothetical protein HB780_11105 (plasmid) [Rhizobium lusitanum]|uniref:jacalin-like lectin n=1 Tax=Rhizobium lusitanum TaxID=293958 RepID=UPI001607D720|nr:hypothetical protein [Rhizobium lusitanum]QND46198.1 hypothetical protein HB780_11105 [Rhizobium lusitanum]
MNISAQQSSSKIDPTFPVGAGGDPAQYCAPLRIIGGDGGDPFDYNLVMKGGALKEISAWVDGSVVRQIYLLFSDDTSFTQGTASDAPDQTYSFAQEETISALSLWGDGVGTRLGRIRFTTSSGGRFDSGGSTSTEYHIDVGSGICVGATGRSGLDIDNLGFYFQRPFTAMTLDDVTYSNLNGQPCNPDRLSKETYTNNGTDEKQYTFSGSISVTDTSTWTTGQTFSLGGSIGLTVGVPTIGEVNSTFTWEVGTSSEQSFSESSTHEMSWNYSGTLASHASITLLAVTYTGQADLPFTGTVHIVFTDGTTLEYPVSGTYEGVSYTSVEIQDVSGSAVKRLVPAHSSRPQRH